MTTAESCCASGRGSGVGQSASLFVESKDRVPSAEVALFWGCWPVMLHFCSLGTEVVVFKWGGLADCVLFRDKHSS